MILNRKRIIHPDDYYETNVIHPNWDYNCWMYNWKTRRHQGTKELPLGTKPGTKWLEISAEPKAHQKAYRPGEKVP